jgi:phospholipid/cholesterol/gamma-HCH transport system permease protein
MTADAASLRTETRGSERRLVFSGRLDADGAGLVWRPAMRAAAEASRTLVLDLSGVKFCDIAGAAFLAAVERAHDGPVAVDGAAEQVAALLGRVRGLTAAPKEPPVRSVSPGELLAAGLRAAGDGLAFLGETAAALARAPARRRMLPVRDVLRFADEAGVRSLPLVLMLGFLFGLILAFQSAVAMQAFGAELYVANLVSISVLRELGPLLASVILAGRTGSAFAAEIGTMQVNEEVSALRTMGLDPVTMLVLPRLMAAMLVMPVMTVVLEVAALFGMLAVMTGLGYPVVAVLTQVQGAARTQDLFGGLFKAVCFGAAVAGIGCSAGLSTGVGPRAVGLSATAAVVGGIVATVILDGLFAVVFYRIGL